MKIENLLIFKVKGKSPLIEGFWEERLVRPTDIYEKFRAIGPQTSGKEEFIQQTFLKIVTDNGDEGIFGPISNGTAQIIEEALKPQVLGEDPFAFEKIWDIMYRSQIHGRKGDVMFAISAIDCALWDLIGKMKNEPVVRLLGGPVQKKVPAYASMLGFSLNPNDIIKRCQEYVDKGFTSMKWFFRHGPGSGLHGIQKNIELVKTVREAVGYDIELMLDCWNSWTVPYTIKMAKKLEKYEPTWLEEPVMPDDIEGYTELVRRLEIPIAGGEHEYTRWGVRELLKRKAVDILQVDVKWAGGITELRKIAALCSAEGIPLIPHAGWVEPSQSITFSQPQYVCPKIEYLVKHSEIQQALNKEKLKPEKGFFYPPSKTGLGFELKIES